MLRARHSLVFDLCLPTLRALLAFSFVFTIFIALSFVVIADIGLSAELALI
jgi:hypothetical protein